MNVMSNLLPTWTTAPPLTSSEKVMKHFQEHEELKCDPLYLAVTLGIVHIYDLQMIKKPKEETYAIRGFTTSLKGVKISFKDNCSVEITPPGFFSQSVPRMLRGEGRRELGYIRPHLIQLLRWFGYKDNTHKTILKMCKCGIEALLKGYQHQQNQEKMTISQELIKKEEQTSSQVTVIKIEAGAPETDLVIRILENDIDLLVKAINEKDERQVQEFEAQLVQEEAKYFPLHRITLIKVEKTIDDYMAEKVIARWNTETLQGIVKLFEAEPKEDFNLHDSLLTLLNRNPTAHEALRTEIRNLLASTLLSCNINIQKSGVENE